MVVCDRYVRVWLARRSSRPGAGGFMAGSAAQPNVVLCVVVTPPNTATRRPGCQAGFLAPDSLPKHSSSVALSHRG